MSAAPLTTIDNSAWIRDLVYLAFPEGEARERVLFDLVKQFSKMDPEDPEWLRYKLNVVECRAMENMARALNEAATELRLLCGSFLQSLRHVLHRSALYNAQLVAQPFRIFRVHFRELLDQIE